MLSVGVDRLSSNNVYTLLGAVKGAPLATGALLAAHGTQDNRGKFANRTLEQVKPEDAQDQAIAKDIQRSRDWEAKVIQHERAHMQAGGEFAGAASYVYVKGADGRTYITGGEVSMKVPAGGDLEKLKYALERVKRAAMAPADPSPQDTKTAAMASAKQAAVNQEITKKRATEAYEKKKQEDPELAKVIEVEPFRKLSFREVSSFEMAI